MTRGDDGDARANENAGDEKGSRGAPGRLADVVSRPMEGFARVAGVVFARLRLPAAGPRFRSTPLLSGIVFLPLILASFPALTWTQVNAPGFGEHPEPYTGQEAFDLTVYNGQLYLGMEGRACARIWRSRAGVGAPSGPADWQQVVANGFDGTTDCAVTPATTDNDHIDSLEPFGKYLYASTAMQTGNKRGTQVWRSASGNPGTWTRVNEPGFGLRTNENFKDMIEFDGLLCGGTGNYGDSTAGTPDTSAGAQVWCTNGVTPRPDRPGELVWTKRNVNGFGQPENVKIWSSATYGGALYFGLEAVGQDGSIWRTRDIDNPKAWEMVFSPADVGLHASRVDALQGFNGYLYIGMEAQGKGAVIYRSANGDRGTWQTAGTPVFGPASGRFISDASTVIGNTLYVSTMDSARGVGVWGTVDGVTWVRLAPPGFGNMATFAAELTGFNGRLYAWTSNYTSGPGVWRGEPAAGKP